MPRRDPNCEDCHIKPSQWGLDPFEKVDGIATDIKLPKHLRGKRWCRECAKNHPSAIDLKAWTKCEDCKKKCAIYGKVGERKKRWCSGCALSHDNIAELKSKRCEDCKERTPNYGMPGEKGRKARWCSQCAKNHPGAMDTGHKKCEDCQEKRPHFGIPRSKGGGEQARWCSVCAKSHENAAPVGRQMCEDCNLKQPSFGLQSDGLIRWCSGCSKEHQGAVVSWHDSGAPSKLRAPARLAVLRGARWRFSIFIAQSFTSGVENIASGSIDLTITAS
eukprot:SAG11_NODE_5585_length_1517_cov_1.241890_2_plen_275_part_00